MGEIIEVVELGPVFRGRRNKAMKYLHAAHGFALLYSAFLVYFAISGRPIF
jgi:hypothetical protein